jgi:hypothetical protein
MTQKIINLKGDTYLEQMGNAIFVPETKIIHKWEGDKLIIKAFFDQPVFPLHGTKPNKKYGQRNWLEKAIKKVKVENLVDKSKH